MIRIPQNRSPAEKRGQVAIKRNASSACHRGQVATEFMLYTAVFMFVAIAAFVVVQQMQSSELPFQQNTVAKETGDGFVTILTLSVKAGEGFSYNYTFPKTLFGRPYRLYMSNLSDGYMIMEWQGEFGDFSYSYDIPGYNYRVAGTCITGEVLVSDQCSNMLMLNNDGENLTLEQVS